MSGRGTLRERLGEPGTSRYAVVCGGALATVLLVLLQTGSGLPAVLPVAAAALASFTRLGPFVLVVALIILLANQDNPLLQDPGGALLGLPLLVLCAAVLGYTAAQYRLQALVLGIIPPGTSAARDTAARPRVGRRSPPEPPARRAPRLVTADEIGALVLSLPLWAALAQVGWRLLPRESAVPGLLTQGWQLVLLAWLIGVAVVLAAAMLGYLRWRRATAEEAALFLQDVLWQETRREQRRVNRWAAWGRLKRRKDEA